MNLKKIARHPPMNFRRRVMVLLVAPLLLTGGVVATSIGAAAAANNKNTTTNVNQTMWHVGPNVPSCTFDPTTLGSTAKNGQAVFHVNAKLGTTVLDVGISGAVPNASYDVDIRCTAPYPIGTISTDAYGNGSTEIVLPSSLASFVSSNTFYVDAAIPPTAPGGPFGGAGGYGDTFISTVFSPLGS